MRIHDSINHQCVLVCGIVALEAKIAKLGDNDADKRAMHTRTLVSLSRVSTATTLC